MKYLAALLFLSFILHHTAAAVTESPDDDDDWEDTSSSPGGGGGGSQEADDDGRVYKNPRNSPSALCPRDEEQATLLNPKPAKPWQGILNATQVGSACPQYNELNLNKFYGEEDCLFLNIYVPTHNCRQNPPVLINFYDGGFLVGDGSPLIYGPENYVKAGIILVTLNFRLGALGFLSLNTPDVPGNAGLKDQVLALKWVKKNIAKFGGDENKITLMGQGSGGASVMYHILSPLSKGLFNNAIIQSGSALAPWALQKNPESNAQKLAQILGIGNSTDIAAFLKTIPYKDIVFAARSEVFADPVKLAFVPTIESIQNYKQHHSYNKPFITSSPIDILKSGKINKVNVIMGLTANDGVCRLTKQFVSPSVSEAIINDCVPDLRRFIPDDILAKCGENETVEIETKILEKYFPSSENITDSFIHLYNDISFILNHVLSVQLLEKYSNSVWIYRYSYTGQADFTKLTSDLNYSGAGYGDSLAYCFDVQMNGINQINVSASDVLTTQRIMEMSKNIVLYGNPNPVETPLMHVVWKPVSANNLTGLDFTGNSTIISFPYADVVKFWGDLAKGQKCLRKCSSDEDCKSKKKKCLCDGACGMSCIKPDRECPELDKPELGDVTVSGRLFGDKAVYSCPHGFHVVGLQSRNCQADGQWAGQPPACKQNIYCLTPPHIEHARHSALPEQATFDLDATIQYHCHTGYVTNGFPRAKCLAIEGQASWYGPDITCEPRSCGPPGELPHGWVTAECHTFGCRAALHCGAGFELVGKAERFCQPDGTWAPNELPTCVLVTAVQCPTPDAPRHGRAVFTSCAYNSIVSYECKYGYRLVGDNTRRCGADKKWSGTQPTCKEINCGHPGRLYNGWLENIEAGTGQGASIIFRCHDSMRMEGNSSTVCLQDGSWRYPLPKCLAPCVVPHVTQGRVILVPSNVSQDTNETIPSSAPTTQIIGSSTMVHHGEALIVLCEKNYEFLSNNPAVTCNNGTWTQIPKCQPARCKRLPKPPKHGMVVAPKTEHGMRARFHCKDGFSLRGPELLLCSFGNWTGEMPICQEVYCPFPGYIEHGKVLLVGNMGLYDYRPYVRKVVNNKQIMYDCDKGYVLLEGPPGATCIGGQWSPRELPSCVPGQHPRLRWSRRRRSIEMNKRRLRRSLYLRKYHHELRKRAAQIAHHEELLRHLDLHNQLTGQSITQNIVFGLNNGESLREKRQAFQVKPDWAKDHLSLNEDFRNLAPTHLRRKRDTTNNLSYNENDIEWFNLNKMYQGIRKRMVELQRPYYNNARRTRGYNFFGLRPRARRDTKIRNQEPKTNPDVYDQQDQNWTFLNNRFKTMVMNEMKEFEAQNEQEFGQSNTIEEDVSNEPKDISKRDVSGLTHSFIAKKIDEMKKEWKEDMAKKSDKVKISENFHLNSELKIDPKPDLQKVKLQMEIVAKKNNSRTVSVMSRGKFKDLPKISTEDMIKRMKRTSRKTEKLNQTTASVPKSNKDKLRQPPSPGPKQTSEDPRSSPSPAEAAPAGRGGGRGGGGGGRVKGPCEPITSEPYVNVEIVKYGREPNVTYSSGTVVRVACGKGYDLNLGFNATAKCVRGRWKPMKPLCEILPCHIPVTENGVFILAGADGAVADSEDVLLNDTSEVLNGQVVQFSCEVGYNVQGASNLRCWHGDWAVTSMPECIPAPCELPAVQHAVYSSGYRAGLTTAHGSSVSIHCERGYSPPAVLQCTLGDIRMRPSEPCQSIEGNISNIREGQDFRGGSDIVREDFDELEYPTSSSTGTDCGPPARVQGTLIYRDGSPSSGTSHQRYPHGTEVTFRCIAAIMGEKSTWKIVCDSGKWVGKSVSCEEEDAIPAGLLGNATCTYRNNEPNVVSFYNDLEIKEEIVEFPAGSLLISRCVDIGKYAMIGPNTRHCMGGEWDGPKPSCFGLNQENDYAMEKPPTVLFRHQLGPIAQSNDGRLIVYPGTILHMECLWMRKFGNPKWNVSHEYRKYPEGWSSDPGRDSALEYRISIFHATQDDSGVFTCITPARQYHAVDIVVDAVHCPPLPMRRGLISSSQSTKMSSEVAFSCANGNSLIGAHKLYCLPSGNWSAPLPLCESVECGEVPIPASTSMQSRPRVSIVSRGVGGRAAFSCAGGWGLRGPSETVCSPSGEWVPAPPTCIEVSCPAPQPPVNGYLLGKAPFRAGDVVQFNCNPAHMMQGQPIVACQDNARWSGETPKCIQACSYPGTTISGRMSSVKFYYKIGETISFTCESGLVLRGTPMLRCLRNGKWSNAIPICSRDPIGNDTFIGANDSDQLAMLNDDPLAYFNSSDLVIHSSTTPTFITADKSKSTLPKSTTISKLVRDTTQNSKLMKDTILKSRLVKDPTMQSRLVQDSTAKSKVLVKDTTLNSRLVKDTSANSKFVSHKLIEKYSGVVSTKPSKYYAQYTSSTSYVKTTPKNVFDRYSKTMKPFPLLFATSVNKLKSTLATDFDLKLPATPSEFVRNLDAVNVVDDQPKEDAVNVVDDQPKEDAVNVVDDKPKELDTTSKYHSSEDAQILRTMPTLLTLKFDRNLYKTDPTPRFVTKSDVTAKNNEGKDIISDVKKDESVNKGQVKRSVKTGTVLPTAPIEQTLHAELFPLGDRNLEKNHYNNNESPPKVIVTRSSIKKDLSSMFKEDLTLTTKQTKVEDSPVEVARREMLKNLNYRKKTKNR